MLAPTLSYKRYQETRFVLLCCYNALGKCCENTREVCKNTITEWHSSFFLFLITFQFFLLLIVFYI